MHRLTKNGVIIGMALAALARCGGGGGSGGAVTSGNACGLMPANTPAPTIALPEAVPPGGAAITTRPAFTALTFERPLAMTQAPGDSSCWFVAEQPGRVLAFANTDMVDSTSVFIDIRSRVDDSSNEGGLLGIAFHPNFANNGQVFLSYTGDDGGLTSYLSRFTSLDGGRTLEPDSEEILLTLDQPYPNHNGGNIVFGPDGYLYIGFGDGGSGNDPEQRAQDTLNLFGSLLRIDVDTATPYGIPPDNPFAGNALCSQGFGATDCPELYAWGLRNPWRWSFDRLTGELWVGDVGQRAREEIDMITAGGNYGWPFFEGTRCNTDAPVVDCGFAGQPPVTDYGRTEGRSVTGGFVYRGSEIPNLAGVYIYADFATGNLFQYYRDGNVVTTAIIPTGGLRIASFGEDSNGELYLTDLISGTLHRLEAPD